MFWLQIISNVLKVLRAGQTPRQVAAGFALGSMAGFSPFLTLQGILLWFIILLFDVNLSSAILGFTVASLAAYLLDPIFHELGYALLVNVDALRPLWTSLYNVPLAPLTRFNNTVVMGGMVSSIVAAPLVYTAMKKFIIAYRTHLGSRIEKWKIYQIISKNSLVRWYLKLRDIAS